MMKGDTGDLSELWDIVEPEGGLWWPLAPGWYVLATVVMVAAIYYAFRAFRRYQANAYRREALRLLQQASSDVQICRLLKRTALVCAGRQTVASLSGKAWCDWLDKRGPREMTVAEREVLITGVYGGEESETMHLRDYAQGWISSHRGVEEGVGGKGGL
ncbi:MAG: DUF4381 domain-containing protein [Verrucomicrobiales bacterium]